MNDYLLSETEQNLLRSVLERHPQVSLAKIFGSRAKGVAMQNSDIDLALWGDLSPFLIRTISGELDELPLPYSFDVVAYQSLRHEPLRQHVDRVGKTFYPVS
jgi:predicted nucleotidyltransferase